MYRMPITRALHEDAVGHMMCVASSPIFALLHFKEE
jgi:hypothetical protein